jgi:hypothetical protein
VLLRIDKGNSDGEYRDDNGDREPRVLCLHPHAKRDYYNGKVVKVGWDGNEHCTDRLRLYFDFHLTNLGRLAGC